MNAHPSEHLSAGISRGKRADWHRRVRTLRAGRVMEGWLADRSSLTAKLIAHCRQFRVQCLSQQRAPCLADEMLVIGLPHPEQVWQREVLLRCDEQAVVFAHTVVPLFCTANDWPLFKRLGSRSLGTTLFADPLVARGVMYYARLHPSHPLYLRAQRALGPAQGHALVHDLPPYLLARRSLFTRKNGVLLVTEVFLPALSNLLVSSRKNEA
jgi:chorismate--pyruvate lyase